MAARPSFAMKAEGVAGLQSAPAQPASCSERRRTMNRILVAIGVSALSAVAFASFSDAIARDASVGAKGAVGGVSAGRDGASVSAGRASVSASREGASVRGGGTSVSAGREGTSVGGGGTSVSGSREGTSVRGGGASREGASVPGDRPGGFVNARGDREYDD